MKNLYLILCTIFFLTSISIYIADCNTLHIDTIHYDETAKEVKGRILNSGDWYVIYPFLYLSIESNDYIECDGKLVPSYLDSAGGIKGGITEFFFQSNLKMPISNIPNDAVVKCQMRVEDPNSEDFCVLPFQWNLKQESVTTSVQETKTKNDIEIYPNPVSKELYLESNDFINNITVFNSMGCKFEIDINDNSINFDNLDAGVYFLSLQLENGKAVIKKVVKH